MRGSKWTWLRDKCIELGYTESAKLAQEIEDVLYQLYGTTNTKVWGEAKEEEIKKSFTIEPYEIIRDPDFCCACIETRRFGCCSECAFGKEIGICVNMGSLYSNFYEMFQKEQSKK